MTAIEGLGVVLSSVEDAGSTVDIAVLVESYSPLLFRVAHSILRSHAEAATVEIRPQPLVVRAEQPKARHSRLGRVQRQVVSEDLDLPAPEAPLTAQERLLIKLAHRADPVEIAALNPALWAVRDADEKKAVKEFFESSTRGTDK